MTFPTPGQVAYDAYGRVTDRKNYQGLPMPGWQELPPKIKEAWEAAAEAVSHAFRSED